MPQPSQISTAAARRSRLLFNLLTTRMTGATSIVMSTVIASNGLRIISSLVLTRLLDAEAFGVMGVLSFLAFTLAMISDTGIYAFVIRHRDGNDPIFLDRIWTIRLIRGCLLTIAMVCLSSVFANYSHKPELRSALMVWSFTFTIEGLSSMSFATAVRSQLLARLSIIELALSATQVFLSVAIAFVYQSYWALISASLIVSVMRTLASYIFFKAQFRRIVSPAPVTRELWAFSKFIVVSSILTIIVSQADKMFFAKFFSLESFGIYSLAVTLSAAPTAMVSPFAHKVLYPFLSTINMTRPEILTSQYYKRIGRVVPLYSFLVGGFIGAAPLVIELLYDPRYIAVSVFIRWLAISSLFYMLNTCAEQLIMIAGNVRILMFGNFVRLLWVLSGVAFAIFEARPSLFVVCIGLVELPVFLYYGIVRMKLNNFRFRDELAPVLVGLAGGLIGAIGSAASLYVYKSFYV